MIIYFSGNVGCGKTTLAKFAAKYLKFFYLNADKYKKQIYSKNIDPKIYFLLGNPVPNTVRKKLYEKLGGEFKKLSKHFKNIIVDETFHSKLGRNKLLKTGKKYFHQNIIIHIQSPIKLIKFRNTNKRKGHLLINTIKMHRSIKKVAAFFPKPDLIINNKSLAQSKLSLISFLSKFKTNS